MSTIGVGDPAPRFRLKDDRGQTVDLEKVIGTRPVVLVFYPGDDTPGCTKQLCAIRDDWSAFQKAGIAVFGVNHADEKSHQLFIDKYRLTVPLLVDEGNRVAKLYGVMKLSISPSKIHRTVVGIARDGTIVFYQHGIPSDKEILDAMTAVPS